MNILKRIVRRIALAIISVFPSIGSVAPQSGDDDQNRIKRKDDRLDVAVRKTRMWVSIFPKLTAEQRADPEVHKIMPWAGRGNFAKMAEITKDQWDPATIQRLKERKGE